MSTFTLPDVHLYTPGCPLLPSGVSTFSPIVSVSGVVGSEATRDTRHPTLKIFGQTSAALAVECGHTSRQDDQRNAEICVGYLLRKATGVSEGATMPRSLSRLPRVQK